MNSLEHFFRDLGTRLDANDDSLSDESFVASTHASLSALGSTDPKLRDNLAWSTLSRFFRSKFFPASKRRLFLETLLGPDYLFFGLRDGEVDSALKRSFSALTVADLVAGDTESGALSSEDISKVARGIRDYLGQESDRRGFEEPIGWVHCLAHAGDAVLAINLHPNIDPVDLIENAKIIQKVIERRGFDVFKWGEEQRLGRPLAQVIVHLAPRTALSEILNVYTCPYLFENPWRQNVLNTLRCTYLHLHWSDYTNHEVLSRLQAIID